MLRPVWKAVHVVIPGHAIPSVDKFNDCSRIFWCTGVSVATNFRWLAIYPAFSFRKIFRLGVWSRKNCKWYPRVSMSVTGIAKVARVGPAVLFEPRVRRQFRCPCRMKRWVIICDIGSTCGDLCSFLLTRVGLFDSSVHQLPHGSCDLEDVPRVGDYGLHDYILLGLGLDEIIQPSLSLWRGFTWADKFTFGLLDHAKHDWFEASWGFVRTKITWLQQVFKC